MKIKFEAEVLFMVSMQCLISKQLSSRWLLIVEYASRYFTNNVFSVCCYSTHLYPKKI